MQWKCGLAAAVLQGTAVVQCCSSKLRSGCREQQRLDLTFLTVPMSETSSVWILLAVFTGGSKDERLREPAVWPWLPFGLWEAASREVQLL